MNRFDYIKSKLIEGVLVEFEDGSRGIIGTNADGKLSLMGNGSEEASTWFDYNYLTAYKLPYIVRIYGRPSSNKSGYDFNNVKGRAILYDASTFKEDLSVFLGVSNEASDEAISRAKSILNKEGKEIVCWNFSKGAEYNNAILEECSELLVVPPDKYTRRSLIGKGIASMLDKKKGFSRILVKDCIFTVKGIEIVDKDDYRKYAKVIF